MPVNKENEMIRIGIISVLVFKKVNAIHYYNDYIFYSTLYDSNIHLDLMEHTKEKYKIK